MGKVSDNGLPVAASSSGKAVAKKDSNVLSSVVKEKLAVFINERIDDLPELFEQIEDPVKKLDALVKFLPYVTPKMSEKAVSTKINVTVMDELKRLRGKEISPTQNTIPDAEIIEDDYGLIEGADEDIQTLV